MIDAPVDAYATTAAAAMPPQFSYSRDGSRSKACAACRFQNQKCKKDCLLAPFFPASEDSKFQKARHLFGVSKMQKILKGLLPEQRAVGMATMIYEAEVHAAHPNTRCLDIWYESSYSYG
ncbi:LOB domain-containing protein 22-like [Zingiber officinale]|uniref:LOB domain-containing protein 22-like n=1 Tax=Zingiber officinale TaxID=94328 RepID=UPI001C4BFB20|nr:LOB domain-containing protein 22-like [Zingiber officinale]